VIRNERTGEEVRFLIRMPELLVMDVRWTKPGHRAPEHLHPGMEERWQVVTGAAAVRIDGVEHRLGPGQWVAAPPGTPHLAWNPTDRPVRLTIEMRPALRWAELVERLFAGEDPIALLEAYPDEIRLTAGPASG
jgi:mannose-6-phosphate isomerase-like protein (cupin superfamily)